MRHATHVHHKIFAPSSFTFPPSGTAVGGLPRSPAEVDCLSTPHRRTGSPSRKKKVAAGGVGVVDVDCFLGISDGQFFVPTRKKELIATSIQFNITADLFQWSKRVQQNASI